MDYQNYNYSSVLYSSKELWYFYPSQNSIGSVIIYEVSNYKLDIPSD